MMILLILLLFNQVNAQSFSKLPKTPRKVSKWPTKQFARTDNIELSCNGKFYQGYKISDGDSGDIVFAPGYSSILCLWKFFPTNCRITFSCSEFSVSSETSPDTCSRKIVTIVERRNPRKWCGKQVPPTFQKPLRTRRAFTAGYLNLGLGNSSQDKFRCSVSCNKRVETRPVIKPSATLNCQCGITSSISRAKSIRTLLGNSSSQSMSRIIGGTIAATGSFPWQASLAVSGPDIFCGGTLISDRHVLTAAHCLEGVDTATLAIIQIILNKYNTDDTAEGTIRSISKVVLHPSFNSDTLANDIAVITLQTTVPISSSILPACLPLFNQSPAVGSVATVSGFGVIQEDNSEASTSLREVDVNIISNSMCSSLNDVYKTRILNTMLCASVPEGGKDACKRDSGGPLVSRFGTKSTIVGIVSWGLGCAAATYPGVYTRVSSFIPWIEEEMKTGRKCTA
ncbi:transmembrane protease serine 6 [Eurytemora carolleeae]|uniref:transmembrane protease serine 6 n=1 Tax=Eurytemora carolleeae TaxID=1294199 RepID=UPI000C78E8F2|nr:transmembrane protease serine 6 [Eurytemora carolleeae]|eukprot:XP_023343911.1 transmembrane protease serine 6-like [Eurytemora affinis]